VVNSSGFAGLGKNILRKTGKIRDYSNADDRRLIKTTTGISQMDDSLETPFFRPFPLNCISPGGWLARQLRIQADGLSGHLDEFWPDIKESGWLGGDKEGWERMPYWLDGVIPLAWLLNDNPMKNRISRYIDYIISHQSEAGWLGPQTDHAKTDFWPQFLALKMLVVYHDATDDPRIPEVVERTLRGLDRHLGMNTATRWAQMRWFESLISIYWLYERKPQPWLLELAVKLHGHGFNWKEFFRRWPLTGPTPKGRWNYAGHVVNNAMALKAGALWWRLTGQQDDRRTSYEMIDTLDRYHGMVTGVFSGDECLAGTSPLQGTELCAVVEYMYSLEILLSILGDTAFADRLEKIAFNALPATLSPDMWTHQYVQQVNQVECSVRENRVWTTNTADANIFGLELCYGCCTTDFSQGWPKFAAHLWMKTPDNGIAAVAYAPSCVKTTINSIPVSVELETGYPFCESLDFSVAVESPVSFPLLLRIPGWAGTATIQLCGQELAVETPGTYHRIEREWSGETRFTLTLPMHPRLERRPSNAASVVRGPLVYALKIGEQWRQINEDQPHREPPHADWEVHPTTHWNYAIKVNESTLNEDIIFSEHPVGNAVFSPDGAPVSAVVTGHRLPEWGCVNGSAQPTPPSPAATNSPAEQCILIPYGCTSLRIAEFPVAMRKQTKCTLS